MTKPDDIPQDVWNEAHEVLDGYLYSKMSPDEAIARAIMAAKAEEREAIAAFCASQAPTVVGELFAAAIRKRGEAD